MASVIFISGLAAVSNHPYQPLWHCMASRVPSESFSSTGFCRGRFLHMYWQSIDWTWTLIDFVHPMRYELPLLVENLAHLLAKLGIERYGLYGYSMGARIALVWAVMEPTAVTHLFA